MKEGLFLYCPRGSVVVWPYLYKDGLRTYTDTEISRCLASPLITEDSGKDFQDNSKYTLILPFNLVRW